MTNDKRISKLEIRKGPLRPGDFVRSFGFRYSGFLRASSFVIRIWFVSSFVIHPRGNAKRIEPPFHAHYAANGQRHADAPVPRRQVTAFSGFADRFPLASIRTHG